MSHTWGARIFFKKLKQERQYLKKPPCFLPKFAQGSCNPHFEIGCHKKWVALPLQILTIDLFGHTKGRFSRLEIKAYLSCLSWWLGNTSSSQMQSTGPLYFCPFALILKDQYGVKRKARQRAPFVPVCC